MNFAKGRTTFALAIMFSLVLHFIALAGIRTVSFVNTLTPDIFLTSLETEFPKDAQIAASQKFPWRGTVAMAETDTQENELTETEEPGERDTPAGRDLAALKQEQSSHVENQAEPPNNSSAMDVQGSRETGAETDLRQEEKSAALLKPFREKLYFELYWLGIYVGNATFEAVQSNGELKITSQAHSTPFVSTFYKVEDYAESTLVNGVPVHFRITQHEGKYRSNKETIFDKNGKKVTFINHLKETMEEHTMEGRDPWDVISAFYYLRTNSMETGKKISLSVFDSNKFLTAEVTVVGREQIEDADQRMIDTVIVKPVLHSDGLFKNKGTILVWFTDDEKRLPVRMETEVPVGKVIAKLMSRESD